MVYYIIINRRDGSVRRASVIKVAEDGSIPFSSIAYERDALNRYCSLTIVYRG